MASVGAPTPVGVGWSEGVRDNTKRFEHGCVGQGRTRWCLLAVVPVGGGETLFGAGAFRPVPPKDQGQ